MAAVLDLLDLCPGCYHMIVAPHQQPDGLGRCDVCSIGPQAGGHGAEDHPHRQRQPARSQGGRS